jgi:hypothetical protein
LLLEARQYGAEYVVRPPRTRSNLEKRFFREVQGRGQDTAWPGASIFINLSNERGRRRNRPALGVERTLKK